MPVSRRSFLKTSAATAAVSLAGGAVSQVLGNSSSATVQAGPGNKWPGRVVINFNRSAITLPSTVDTAAVKKMIDDSVLLLAGKEAIGEAWKAIFPATLSATSKIAIKVPLGCANQTMAPHWSSVKAIIDGITQMDFAGTKFPAANITIYEMQCSDNFSRYGYTATNLPGVKILRDSNSSGATDGAKNLQYAKSLQSADFLINVFRPGGHSSDYGGFTLGFKNHFGTYAPHHGSTPGEYLRDTNCTGAVFNKNVLSVCVGLFGAKEIGSPGDSAISYLTYAKTMDPTITEAVPPTTIIMSTDPITAEMQAIKMMRVNNGKKYTPADLPTYLKASGGVSGALSDKTYNIGVISEENMDIRRIVNGKVITTAANRKSSFTPAGVDRIRVAHIPSSRTAFVEFGLPHSAVGTPVNIEFYTLKGDLVHSAQWSIPGIVSHYSWNERDTHGTAVPSGMYLVRVAANNVTLNAKLRII
jgi:hypothetical protein